MRIAFRAIIAMAAHRRKRKNDMIAFFDRSDAWSDFSNDAGAFMAEDKRQRHTQVARHDMEIAMTTAIRGDFHAHLACFGRSKLDIFDDERFPSLVGHCSFHLFIFSFLNYRKRYRAVPYGEGWLPVNC